MQSQPLRPTASSLRLPPRLSLAGASDSQHPPPCPVSGSTVEEQQQAPPPSAPEHIDAAASGCSTSCNATNSAMSRDPVGRRAIGSGGSPLGVPTTYLPDWERESKDILDNPEAIAGAIASAT